jgi:protein ImuB
MYACVSISTATDDRFSLLRRLAEEFSPEIEEHYPSSVVFSVIPLERLIGHPAQVASEIARRMSERHLHGRIGMAAHPDLAILAAACLPGVNIIPKGQERRYLGSLPVERLPLDAGTRQVLHRWAIQTVDDLCGLPSAGLAERLGAPVLAVLRLLQGENPRPLNPRRQPAPYEERLNLEYPVGTVEPLLFLVSRVVGDLCARLESQNQATAELYLQLLLEPLDDAISGSVHTCHLQLPFPTRDARALLKLLQLDLEAHPPRAAVTGFRLRVTPVAPRKVQHGLYEPPLPQPEKLELTLTKIRALVGADGVGSPELLNTHRPDAWRMRPSPPGRRVSCLVADPTPPRPGLRLAFRYFRPAIRAQVETQQHRPCRIWTPGVYGLIREASGPWRLSGDWWSDAGWSREEWDVEMQNGTLYRIYSAAVKDSSHWFLEGSYD